MTRDNRWRFRFSVRTLGILITLACVYFGSWPWLEERATKDVQIAAENRFDHDFVEAGSSYFMYNGPPLFRPSSKLPFILSVDESTFDKLTVAGWHKRHYLWLFGWTLRLPITTDRLPATHS